MTIREISMLAVEPFLHPLRRQVRRALRSLVNGQRPAVLDAGGRNSPYTIGLDAAITVSDLPRESAVQKQLHLGLTANGIAGLKQRSNIYAVVFDDMTRTALPAASFDGVVAVEVLEHVEADEAFVRNVARVLKPGGWFLMTTPNGDYKTVIGNPDHRRHYRRAQLAALLGQHLADVDIRYACPDGRLHRWGIQSWRKGPLVALRSAGANLLSQYLAARPHVGSTAHGTHHLFAVARKPHGCPVIT